jgi:crotonobetainyl-CoA:carnitine CoA-transferase CaiB-like acyl-CoA transferase
MLPSKELPLVQTGQTYDLLDGIRVLDLTTSIAGPYATMMLSDMGAEVIKVERPERGDDARQWGPPFLDGQSLWFLSVNRNKKSLTLDIVSDDGKQVLHDLVAASDIVVTNQIPRVQLKLGTDFASLRQLRPDLIYVAITGYGLSGERRDRACYDLIAEGYSSVMDLTGEAENEPQKVGTPAADMLAGMDAAFAAVSAIADRNRTGRGHVIDISLVESMTRFMAPRLMSYLGSGEVPRRTGARDSVVAIYQTFETADAPLTLALGNDNLWKRFWTAVGQPETVEDKRWDDNVKRRQHRDGIVARIAALLKTEPRDHWLELFATNGVPAGPIYQVDEVTSDDALLERGLFYAVASDDGSPQPQVNGGFHLDGRANRPRSMPPQLGADNVHVLGQILGYDDNRMALLKKDGVI